MSDGDLEVTGHSTVTGEAATVRARVDENGRVVIVCPPPGSVALDPRTQLLELQDVLHILGDVARKRGPRGRQP